MTAITIRPRKPAPVTVERHEGSYGKLKRERDELDQMNTVLSDLLDQTANSLKGLPKPGSMHSWDNLPDVAATYRQILEDKGLLP